MKDGYYWIRPQAGWDYEIALYQNGVLYFTGSEEADKIEDMAEIGDYIEMPDKYKG